MKIVVRILEDLAEQDPWGSCDKILGDLVTRSLRIFKDLWGSSDPLTGSLAGYCKDLVRILVGSSTILKDPGSIPWESSRIPILSQDLQNPRQDPWFGSGQTKSVPQNLQSWPKCVGHFTFYAKFLQCSLPPLPSPHYAVLGDCLARPFLLNNIEWRRGRFGPKKYFYILWWSRHGILQERPT